MTLSGFHHIPVMATEVVKQLCWRQGGTYVDATVGGGGHARLLLETSGPGTRLIAIDQDPGAVAAAQKALAPYSHQVTFIRSNFVHLRDILTERGFIPVDGVLFDLGVSSYQLDTPERGFSYQHDAPLDMRMDPAQPVSAQDLLATASEAELARIIKEYGEEKWADRIARFIVRQREKRPIKTTGQLVDIIKAAIPAAARRQGPHPARRTFQALRIAVNHELEYLEQAIRAAVDVLREEGRIAIITFHSLEDRIVKHTLRDLAAGCQCPPQLPVCVCGKKPQIEVLTRQPIVPSATEVAQNPRARSAKLRVGRKVLSRERDE